MTDNAKKFLEAVSADKELENELNGVLKENNEPEKQLACIVEFAKAKGIELTKEDLLPEGQKIDLDELDNVAGGGGCGCAIVGYGTNGGLDCTCLVGGNGLIDDYDKINSQGGCVCIASGAGATNKH